MRKAKRRSVIELRFLYGLPCNRPRDAELIRWDLVMYGTAAEVGPSGGIHSSMLAARSVSVGPTYWVFWLPVVLVEFQGEEERPLESPRLTGVHERGRMCLTHVRQNDSFSGPPQHSTITDHVRRDVSIAQCGLKYLLQHIACADEYNSVVLEFNVQESMSSPKREK
uniref:Uncharacterized protein n=1 Tax=Ascaris lumbricoides TaxID=6252 RepID=A0A9J2PF05_ASCLU